MAATDEHGMTHAPGCQCEDCAVTIQRLLRLLKEVLGLPCRCQCDTSIRIQAEIEALIK